MSEQGRAFERVRESFVKQGLMGLLGSQGEQGRRRSARARVALQ